MMPRLSPDGRSLVFTMLLSGRARRMFIAPYTGQEVPASEWKVLVEGTDFDRQPYWAPSGQHVYFLSDRDGFRCVWAQRVDQATRQDSGAPFAAHHLHQIRYNLEPIGDVARGRAVGGGRPDVLRRVRAAIERLARGAPAGPGAIESVTHAKSWARRLFSHSSARLAAP